MCEDIKSKVRENLGLVISIASRYDNYTCNDSLQDLIQEGVLALTLAISKGQEKMAAKYIKNAIIKESIRQQFPFHIPDKVIELMMKIIVLKSEKKEIDRVQLETTWRVSSDILNSALFYVNSLSSNIIDNNIDCDQIIGVFDKSMDKDIKLKIKKAVSKLNKEEQKFISLRFGFNEDTEHSIKELSVLYTRSNKEIRDLEKTILDKLKQIMNN